MTYTIPFAVEEGEQECVIELLDLSQKEVIAEIHRSTHPPGSYSVLFDPTRVHGGLEAGLYILRVAIGEQAELFPLQYMP